MTISSQYTQGLVFGHNNPDYARAVVDRSCSAILMMLHDAFSVAERNGDQHAAAQASRRDQYREFCAVDDIVRARVPVEQAVLAAVVCAYAQLMDGQDANRVQIERLLASLPPTPRERLDLLALFHADVVIRDVTNRNRPLLIHLAAQLAKLFEANPTHIDCMPMSPAVLVHGFIAGLMSVEMDLFARQVLFETFQQEFLAKFSMLVNSMITRLEDENLVTSRATGFDEMDPGPVGGYTRQAARLDMATLHARADALHAALEDVSSQPVTARLVELSAEASTESLLQLVVEAGRVRCELEAPAARAQANEQETVFLRRARQAVSDKLDAALAGISLPPVVAGFLEKQWQDILFDCYVNAGEQSERWQELATIQQQLVQSVTPVTDDASGQALSRNAPQLVRQLRQTFDQAGFRLAEFSGFLDQLKQLHVQNVQKKLRPDMLAPWKSRGVSDSTPPVANILDPAQRICYEQVTQFAH